MQTVFVQVQEIVCSPCSDQIVQQVLDELGLQIEGDLSAIPSTGSSVAQGAGAAKQPVAAGGVNDADADLEARLDALRRN